MPSTDSLLTGAGLVLLGAAGGWWLARRLQRRRAEALRLRGEAVEGLRRALDLLEEGVILVDASDRVLAANAAARRLVRAPEGGGGAERPRLQELIRDEALLEAVRASAGHEVVRQQVEARDEEGAVLALALTLAPAPRGGRVLILRDERVREEIDQRRRDFVANASHQLQTPIAAIIGLLDLLDTVPEETRPTLLQRARRNAQALSNLTRDLLGLARAQDPDWKTVPQEIEVASVVEEVMDPIRAEAEGRGLEVAVSVEPPELRILVDRIAFATVLQNLASNAAAYTREGRIQVRVRPRPMGGLVLEVEDTGSGIEPEKLNRIFERFFRGDPAQSRASGGTGLGLSIVRNLLRRMGGRISVRSEPGAGSTFAVELPDHPSRPLPGAGLASFHSASSGLPGPGRGSRGS